MGYIATDLARIPSQGFDWFVYLLEDGWNDDLRRELSDNFQKLAEEVGPDVLVIRGASPQNFYDAVFESYALLDRGINKSSFSLPALLLSDQSPQDLKGNLEKLKQAKIILFPLAKQYIRPGSITYILKEIANTLREHYSLKSFDRYTIEKKWGWITRYFDLKPNFFGFGVDINEIINDLFLNKNS